MGQVDLEAIEARLQQSTGGTAEGIDERADLRTTHRVWHDPSPAFGQRRGSPQLRRAESVRLAPEVRQLPEDRGASVVDRVDDHPIGRDRVVAPCGLDPRQGQPGGMDHRGALDDEAYPSVGALAEIVRLTLRQLGAIVVDEATAMARHDEAVAQRDVAHPVGLEKAREAHLPA